MRAFLVTAAVVFGLVAVLHVWRMVAESHALARDPWFLLLTALAVGLCIWAVTLLLRSRKT